MILHSELLFLEMPRCVVIGCSISSENKEGIRSFSFPKTQEDARQWAININRANWNPTKNSRVCSRHFTDKYPSEKIFKLVSGRGTFNKIFINM